MSRSLTVLLPAFDVAAAMPSVVRDLAVAAYALRARDVDLELVLVTGPGDDTAAAARREAQLFDLPMHVLPPVAGPGEAFLEGFRHVVEGGRGDLLVTMDANGRHDASEIPRLVDQLLEGGHDLVIGSRWAAGSGTPGLSPGRWALGRMANLTFQSVTGIRGLKDATTSFRVYRTEVLRGFSYSGSTVTSHSVQTAVVTHLAAQRHQVAEGPIIYRPPLAGGSGLQPHDVGQFATHLVRLRQEARSLRRVRLAPQSRHFRADSFGAADDLERLGTAKYFFAWVLEEFAEHLKGRVLEVGAGVGTITRKLADGFPDLSVVALEPASNMYGELEAYAQHSPAVEAHCTTLAEFGEAGGSQAFDAVLYLNVLEHIEDEEQELRLAAAALRPGGALLVFGPALEWLYSELDLKAGHYRRYTLDDLRQRVTAAGFEVLSARYFDVLGVLPYFAVYRLLGHDDITGSTMWGYDRVVVPVSRLVQRLVPQPPMGKNVILVAVKR